MNILDPYSYVSLDGDAILRGVTITLPRRVVRRMLPRGLALGEQSLTPEGTHPVVLWFQEMIDAHLSIPTLVPRMNYLEHIFGIPFTHVTEGTIDRRTPGPYLFMARLYLDDFLATLGGVLWWGFAKEMAELDRDRKRFTVHQRGEPLIALRFTPSGPFADACEYPHFAAIRSLMRQPLVSQIPLALGPYFACSDFDRDVERGEVRPLTTVVTIEEPFVPGLPCGRYPEEGRAPGIDVSPLGSYEIRSPWRQGLIYSPRPRSSSAGRR